MTRHGCRSSHRRKNPTTGAVKLRLVAFEAHVFIVHSEPQSDAGHAVVVFQPHAACASPGTE